jgi:hypothetical protein
MTGQEIGYLSMSPLKQVLVKDIVFLVRSLGFLITIKTNLYNLNNLNKEYATILSITGENLHTIPVKQFYNNHKDEIPAARP